ncbi:MAG: hypothetical protein O6704_04900 [Nitrospinae bacterium]|nr:hypothetical protein [Nitrospinota bacterium]
MLEIGITLFILLVFIFPVPGLAVCLGAWTCYLIYRKLLLLKCQPPQWRKIVWIQFLTGATNTFLSAVMALMLAFTVYFLIIDSLRLFIFNFFFCFLISFRWFDFTHSIYRSLVLKLQPLSLPPQENGVFCMLLGQRSGTGLGIGMASVSLDSGYLYWEGNRLVFDGVMARKYFSRNTVLTLEKISSEKIKIMPVQRDGDETAEAWVLVLRQQFYPFKTRELRDQWFQRLSGLQENTGPAHPLAELESSPNPSA